MWEVCGTIRTDIGGTGGLVHTVQDLGVERRGHLVHDFTGSLLPEFPPSFNDVLHCDLQGDRLHLECVRVRVCVRRGGEGLNVVGTGEEKSVVVWRDEVCTYVCTWSVHGSQWRAVYLL